MPRDPHLRTSLGSNPLGEHGVRGRFGTGTLEPDGQRGVVRPFKFGCVMTTAVTQPTRENLPVELTSFVGRSPELNEVRRLLSSACVITSTGPGRTGKSRLGLRTARRNERHFPDGVSPKWHGHEPGGLGIGGGILWTARASGAVARRGRCAIRRTWASCRCFRSGMSITTCARRRSAPAWMNCGTAVVGSEAAL